MRLNGRADVAPDLMRTASNGYDDGGAADPPSGRREKAPFHAIQHARPRRAPAAPSGRKGAPADAAPLREKR